MSNTLSHLHWRAAIKAYDSTKKLSEDQVELLANAANLAPTSFGIQPLKLWIVSDEKVKQQLREAGYNQPSFTDASHIFVFAVRTNVEEKDVKEYVHRIMDQRGVSHEDVAEYEQMMLGSVNSRSASESQSWAARQAYIALGMTLAEAARNEIDTTPMEGFDNAAFDKILNVGEEYHVMVCMAAGFRSEEDKYSKMPKVRKDISQFVERV